MTSVRILPDPIGKIIIPQYNPDVAPQSNHPFLIVSYFQDYADKYVCLLLSSKISKASYPYNYYIEKNSINNLSKNSILKCDRLYIIDEAKINDYIGEISLEEYLDTANLYQNAEKTNEVTYDYSMVEI